MKKSTMMILIIVLLAVGGAGALLLNRKSDAPATNTTNNQPSEETKAGIQEAISESEEAEAAPAAATITYSDNGFSPETVTVKAGEVIEVKNTSSRDLQFDSDPHPVHSDNRELNIDDIPAGESKKFKVDTKGTWGYHNHLDASETGTIVVQ